MPRRCHCITHVPGTPLSFSSLPPLLLIVKDARYLIALPNSLRACTPLSSRDAMTCTLNGGKDIRCLNTFRPELMPSLCYDTRTHDDYALPRSFLCSHCHLNRCLPSRSLSVTDGDVRRTLHTTTYLVAGHFTTPQTCHCLFWKNLTLQRRRDCLVLELSYTYHSTSAGTLRHRELLDDVASLCTAVVSR